ncbi:MAG: aminodeoxychorismate synthase component I [Sulfurimonas sp.]|nr:aminodeoxychorismate synthase component I [Sulfurimonas sp.]MDQ7059794.1 aminodeoxychorismate synthase component I [Sulfurimonas sp.]
MTFSDINALASKRVPFLFISDFKAKNLKLIPLDKLLEADLDFEINENINLTSNKHTIKKNPSTFGEYKKKFDKVIEEIKSGNTYLLNLTQKTSIESDLTLNEIYTCANAKYKLRYKDEFVCFSPESFVKIKNNKIHTFPMKGTIDASLENAKEKILKDKKEMAEHVMVVDLLRNDLSIRAKNVRVKNFRYLEEIQAGDKNLLQVSSHISGELEPNWHKQLGSILETLLPAGSISGAPKKSTLEIIESIEDYERGYFCGVFGVFDGESFDSGVMIRFIQKTRKGYVYKSGGGITLDSDATSEYEEMLDKVYLP